MRASEAEQRRALAAGLVLVVLWAASFTIQKIAYQAMGPGTFLFLRSALMASCAGLLLLSRGHRPWPRPGPGRWRAFLIVTAVGPVLHIVLVTYGIHWSTAFSSALIMACGPVCTLILLRLLRGTRLGRRQWLGVGAAFCGVLLVMSDKLLAADWRAGIGDLTMLVAAVVFSLYTIWITPFVVEHGGVKVMCWTTLLAAPALLLLSLGAVIAAPPVGLAPTTWAAFGWTVIVSAFLGWMMWGWINAVRGVVRTAPLLYLVPPVAGVVAWLTVGEAFGALKIVGALLALAGVAATQWVPHGGETGPARPAT